MGASAGKEAGRFRPVLPVRPDRPIRPDLGEGDLLFAEVDAANERLAAHGVARRVAPPAGDVADRDRVSTALLFALKETRDRAFLEALWRLNARIVLRFCRSRLRGIEPGLDASELLDDTFLQLWLKCDRFQERPDATFTGWALVIAENRILQALRGLRRDRRRARVAAERATPPPAPDPAARAAENERAARLRAEWLLLVAICAGALASLPARPRAVLDLRERVGLDYAAIAARLGMTRGGVAMALRRGRAQVLDTLRRCLALGSGGSP